MNSGSSVVQDLTSPAYRVQLGTGATFKEFTISRDADRFKCTILGDDTLKCWGRNQFGQLGLGHTNQIDGTNNDLGDLLPRVNLGTGMKVASVSAGSGFSCAILFNHDLKCWGVNASGQLGQGDAVNRGDSNAAGHEMGDLFYRLIWCLRAMPLRLQQQVTPRVLFWITEQSSVGG